MTCIKIETQKIVNLLNDTDNESSNFATRKWYIINDQNNGQYSKENENDSSLKFETKVIKPNLCDYSDAYIFVEGNIKFANFGADTNVSYKDFAPFTRCVTHNNEHVQTAESLDIRMPMYNLLEYSNNYADSFGNLYQIKRDEFPLNNAENILNFAMDNSSSFKHKASLLGKADDDDGNDRSLKKCKDSCSTEISVSFF